MEDVQHAWHGASLQGIGPVLGLAHDLTQLLVHVHEGLGFHRQLALNVTGTENGLQVHPGFLRRHPLIQRLCEESELALHFLYLGPDARHKARRQDSRHGDHAVLQGSLDVLNAAQHEHVLHVLVLDNVELHIIPPRLYFAQQLLQSHLLSGFCGNLGNLIFEVVHLGVQQHLQGEAAVPWNDLADDAENLSPVALLECAVPQGLSYRQQASQLVNMRTEGRHQLVRHQATLHSHHRLVELVDGILKGSHVQAFKVCLAPLGHQVVKFCAALP
mmetsp:Transcript_10036/g.27370  ORF Transcript_10036/g.27370 Transcript_10036/m.27370 type:complete len:273 (-) Transcript_10036:2982-3800(-)